MIRTYKKVGFGSLRYGLRFVRLGALGFSGLRLKV